MNSVTWFGSVFSVFFVSMATGAALARAAATTIQSEPSDATPSPLVDGREVRTSVTLEGFVLAPDGSPAEGALVTSSAGGKALTDADGGYRLEVEVPLDASIVEVTAVGNRGTNLVASASVARSAATSWTRVDPLRLSRRPSCTPSWIPTFGGMPGTDGDVGAFAVFDDGTGPALYVGGGFSSAGGVPAIGIAKWDGSSWSALGSGVGGAISALAVYDDGNGPALYAGGSFSTAGGVPASNIAKWDGTCWTALGTGLNDTVTALAVHDDGTGPALYAGGGFTIAGSVPANRIARWNGASWSPLGTGLGIRSWVSALAVYDDGGGPALYAGGSFYSAGSVTVRDIAKWDGASWSALGGGMNDVVGDLAVYDDGHGPALIAAGQFSTAGGVTAIRVAKWNGASWSALGNGIGEPPEPGDDYTYWVSALAVYDDGRGPALYAGGKFDSAGACGIARWDGASWSALDGSCVTTDALVVHDDGSGPALFAGGSFAALATPDGEAAHIAKWDGSRWSALDRGGLNSGVRALAVHDDGGGPALFASGSFAALATPDGEAARIAKWDGSRWAALNRSGLSQNVLALAVHDDGGGPALYAGGQPMNGDASQIEKWDGSSWSLLGSMSRYSWVYALAEYDDGAGHPAHRRRGGAVGAELYAGGYFTSAGGVPANWIAKWDGSSWAGVGSGMNSFVEALAVHDDGSGPALYAGGGFTTAGGVPANKIAKWNGSRWAPLGSGVSGTYAQVLSLAVYDDGSGPALYAGGVFTSAGGVAANGIAKWDGSSWAPLGSGVSGGTYPQVLSLAVYDDGNGPQLFAGGDFTVAGGVAANRIARWDGSSWSALGSGVNGSVQALTVYDDGTGPALYVGGNFTSALDSGDSFLAKWGCADTTSPVLTCPSSITVVDRFANGPGEVVTFTVTATDDLDPSPVVACVPPSGSIFPPGTTLVVCTATDASGKRSTCQFPVTVVRKADRR